MSFYSAQKIKKIFKYLGYIIVIIFAIIGITFTGVFIGMHLGLFNVKGSITGRNQFFLQNTKVDVTLNKPCLDASATICNWNETPQWQTVSGGLTKDADVINKVAGETGVQARMIVAVVAPEQTRFFTSNREVWKGYFEPLKVLISLSQFSLGVSGIKEDTAKTIENYASDKTSNFYPGDDISSLIAYSKGIDHDTELYNRLTDEKNHYYQYLYTAIYIKEIEAQWQKAGFDITHNPETIVTLFNIGFGKSIPNSEPVAGGAPINLGGKIYTYGELGSLFYYSDEMTNLFPKVTLSAIINSINQN